MRDFPGSPVVKTPHFTAGGTGSIPGQGTKIPHAVWRGQKKQSVYYHWQQIVSVIDI